MKTPKMRKITFTHPGQVKCLRDCAREYNRKNGTRLSAGRAIVRALTEALDHPN